MLYAILDRVVDGYAPVVAGLQKDIDEIETQVFGGDPKVSRRIYELSGEVIEFQRATRPLLRMLDGLVAGFAKYRTDEELQRYLRDVTDHATTVAERVDGFRQALADILTPNATLVSQAQNEEIRQLTEASYDQNEDVKRVSAWAAILFAPTLIGTVYGMNFDNMPDCTGSLVTRSPWPDDLHQRRAVRDLQAPRLALSKTSGRDPGIDHVGIGQGRLPESNARSPSLRTGSSRVTASSTPSVV